VLRVEILDARKPKILFLAFRIIHRIRRKTQNTPSLHGLGNVILIRQVVLQLICFALWKYRVFDSAIL
jgi:hypothetical protein